MSTKGRETVRASRTRARATAVALTVASAVVTWVVIDVVAGADLRAPAFGGRGGSQDVGAVQVITASTLASLAAWAALALLERTTSRPRVVWLIGAIAAFLLSLSGPLSGAGVETNDRLLLALLHLVAAAVLIPSMLRTTGPADAGDER